MSQLVIDIETWPESDDVLGKFYTPLPDFDPNTVKTGNIKDAIKKREKIEAARLAYKEKSLKHYADFVEASTLNPLTCKVFGYVMSSKVSTPITYQLDPSPGVESAIIRQLWEVVERASSIYGWNLHGFDIPVLVQRSRILGIPHPKFELPLYRNDWTCDLMTEWSMGGKNQKLDNVAKALGIAGKTDIDGRLPWQVFRDGDTELGEKYIRQDGNVTWEVGKKMGIIRD